MSRIAVKITVKRLPEQSTSDLESSNSSESSSETDGSDTENDVPVIKDELKVETDSSTEGTISRKWTKSNTSFKALYKPPDRRSTLLLTNLQHSATPLDCFFKMMPKSFFIFMAECTNERLAIYKLETKKDAEMTEPAELIMLTGIHLAMGYCKMPSIKNYWSQRKSLGNAAIVECMSRNRFEFLSAKLYCQHPKKPESATKLYYTEELMNCIKYTFLQAREDSYVQSIDESMTKFKGQSSLKQYMPLKPTKRGIKIWQRCDSMTGYVYDANIYCGRIESENCEVGSTLGERVVKKLVSTIRKPDVMLAFDRFFTSVQLMETIGFPAVGTFIQNQKNLPNLEGKLNRGESVHQVSSTKLMAVKWMDRKDVFVLSNMHEHQEVIIQRKEKDGSKKDVCCPAAIVTYNAIMGGVDLSDQLVKMYEINRKSTKWWKKVFYRMLDVCVVNAHVIYQQVTDRHITLFDFKVELAESMMAYGKNKLSPNLRRGKPAGRKSKIAKNLFNVGDHLPIESLTRKRCAHCSVKKIEKRTKTMCKSCNIPLCKNCFTPFHS